MSVLPWTIFPSKPVLEIGMRDGPQEETFQTSQRVSFSSGPWASSSMPLFSQLEVAPDGTIWLRAYQPFRREEVTDWYVMGSEEDSWGEGTSPPASRFTSSAPKMSLESGLTSTMFSMCGGTPFYAEARTGAAVSCSGTYRCTRKGSFYGKTGSAAPRFPARWRLY